jgi:hypothetical protein
MSVFTGVSAALPGSRREAAEFARLLETGRAPAASDLADLVELARSLAPAEHRPAPEFRAALRDRLVAEAASRPTTMPAQRAAEPAPGPRRPRLAQAVAAVAVASVVAGVGAAAASSRALPGDALYGLKRQIEDVQLALAGSDLERGRELLEQAEARLGEAERLAAAEDAATAGTRQELDTALAEMSAATEAGAAALTDSYRETGDREPMLLLDRFVTEQEQRLRELYDLLDPALRARVAALVDELARLGATARAVLPSAASGAVAEAAGAAGDGWAVSRLLDRAAVVAAQQRSGLDLTGVDPLDGVAVGGAGGGEGGTAGGAGGGGDGNLIDDTVDAVTGGGTTGGSPGGGLGGGTPTLPDVTTPLPDVSTPPLPDVSTPPLPNVSTPPLPSTGSPPLPSVSAPPLPSAGACVPVPPLTSC